LEVHTYNDTKDILCKELGIKLNWEQVRYAARKAGVRPLVDRSRSIPPQTAWTLTGDWVIAGDLHCPHIDWDFAEVLIEQACRYKINNLLICGDVFDVPTLSQFPAVLPPAPPQEEEEIARAFFEEMRRTFSDIRILTGNHDWRIFKSLQGAITDTPIIAMLLARLAIDRRAQWSIYSYCLINTSQGVWRVTHPRNYSRVILSIAQQLASKYGQNIITFHEHSTGIGLDRSGQHVVATIGCMADPHRLPWGIYMDTTMPAMTQSFGILRDGRLKIIDKHGLFW
jgi:hypothetical protein